MKMKNILPGLIAILLGTFIALVLGEALLRLFWKEGSHYYLWPPGYQTELTPRVELMPGVEPVAHLRVNSNGIRGSEWSDDRKSEYRIITIGGSTTECLYLDQAANWSTLLEKGLDDQAGEPAVWVGNLGRAGFNSRDHVAFMQHVLDQYDVDAVVMLLGGNDMIHRLMKGDGYDPRFMEDKPRFYRWLRKRFVSVPVTSPLFESSWYKRTYLFGFLRRYRRALTDRRNVVRDKSGAWIGKLRAARRNAKKTDELIGLDSGLAEYESNIRTIIREANNRGVDLVLLTQPAIWHRNLPVQQEDSLWWGVRADGEYYSSGALATAMERYNQRLLDVCADTGTACIDMAARIPQTSDIYYDDMHYTKYGSEFFASVLLDELRRNKLLLFARRQPARVTENATQ